MASNLPESQWVFTRVPGGYVTTCPALGITISAEEIKRQSDSMTSLMTVRSTMVGLRTVEDDILKIGTLNFYAATSRSTWAKEIAKRCPGEAQSLDWDGFLERFVAQVIAAERIGEPSINLADLELTTGNRYLIPGMVSAEETTIWFGDGGSMKSYLALAAGATIATGHAGFLGLQPTERRNVGYVDWEWGAQAHRRRLGRLANGGPLPPIRYIRCDRPLTHEVARLQRLVREHDLGFLILDSIAFGCDAPPEQADTATRYVSAVRQLGVPCLLIAHVTKADDGDKKPFGCYSSDTEVLTRRGWLLHQNLTLDDEVACFDQEADTLRWQHPSIIHEYDYAGEMVHVNGGSMDMLVTPNHRMVVAPAYPLPTGTGTITRNQRRWQIKEAGSLSKSPWYVPYATPFESAPDEHAVSPAFAKFLGWWLSEGSLSDDAPVLTQAEGPLAVEMREAVASMGYEANAWIGRASTRPHEQPVMQLRLRGATDLGRWLQSIAGDHSWNKHVPDLAWSWNEEGRRNLFDALMEGDGGWRTPDRGTYTTVSPRLADDVQRLAISLGYSARIRVRPSSKGHYDQYQIAIGRRRRLTIRQDHGNLARQPYDGKVYCLTVPTGAYLTRRNGYMGIAGNSSFWHNSSRLTWYIKKAGEYGERTTVGMFGRKNNDDRPSEPLAFSIWFQDDLLRTVISPASIAEIADAPDLADKMPLKLRIAAVVKEEPKTIVEIATALDSTVAVVAKTVDRAKGDLFAKVMGPDHVYRVTLIQPGSDIPQ